MSTPRTPGFFRRIALACAGGALALGAVAAGAPAASAAVPAATPSHASIESSHVGNVSIGTFLQLHNGSDEAIQVRLTGNERIDVTIRPGDHVDIQGNAMGADDISGTIRFADGTTLPVYAHNPDIRECYVQVGGHKWHGSGGHSIAGKSFHADWNGNWKDPNGDTWKDWDLTLKDQG